MSSNEIARAKPTELTETERDTIPLRSIDELQLLVAKEWGALDILTETTRKKTQAIRIKIGRYLLEMQQRIDAGENGDQCTFWEWFADMFTRSRSDAERMMTIARQDDPEAAYQQRLEKQKEYIERHYRKKLGAPTLKMEAPGAAVAEELPDEPQPELLPPSPEPYQRSTKRYPDSPEDDSILEEMGALFMRLSWNGRDRTPSYLAKLYDELRRGAR